MKHVYLIMDQEQKSQSTGLSYFNLTRFFDEKTLLGRDYKDLTTWLQFAQVGIQSQIDYANHSQRLAYIKSYSEIQLIPTLHSNQVTFIGQKKYDDYLAIQQD